MTESLPPWIIAPNVFEKILDKWHQKQPTHDELLGAFNVCTLEHPTLLQKIIEEWFNGKELHSGNIHKIDLFLPFPLAKNNLFDDPDICYWDVVKTGRNWIKASVQDQLRGWKEEKTVHQCPMIETSTFNRLSTALTNSLRKGRTKLFLLGLISPHSPISKFKNDPLGEIRIIRCILEF